jgi:Na+-transporting NADH:ubiquinone oxidoreductase subunit NqrC
MDYRESRGGEVRDPRWRAQFSGKSSGSALRLDSDIQNISGATLSCRHITEGIKRLLAIHAAALAK